MNVLGGYRGGTVNTFLVFLCLTTVSEVPANVLVRGILSSLVPPPRTPHGTAQPADLLHFPALRTCDMMGSLASGSGWYLSRGGRTLVVRNLYRKLVGRMIKMPEKCRTG